MKYPGGLFLACFLIAIPVHAETTGTNLLLSAESSTCVENTDEMVISYNFHTIFEAYIK